ncbi:MAG: nitrilase-related carbon-nitrogen hydrolase [Acidimicrobiales bacterium]
MFAAIDTLSAAGQSTGVDVVCGTLLYRDNAWWNTAIHLASSGERTIYKKVNLATKERGRLTAGSSLPLFQVQKGGDAVTVAPQLCREIRFPEQWHVLARRGARLFAYLTNVANPAESELVWRSHLISRAAETQRFVASVNCASKDTSCPTMVVSPRGEILAEATRTQSLLRVEIDTEEVSSWFLDQHRGDVASVQYREQVLQSGHDGPQMRGLHVSPSPGAQHGDRIATRAVSRRSPQL